MSETMKLKFIEVDTKNKEALPPKPFRIGSHGYEPREEPQHTILIPENYWLAETPVTQGQIRVWDEGKQRDSYERWPAFDPKPAFEPHKNRFPSTPNHPAEMVSWWQAILFCAWFTEAYRKQLPPGYSACLPTEAEWEVACRAGTSTEYYTGDGLAALYEAGWFNTKDEPLDTRPIDRPQPVGKLARNDLGLADMHGNVWEWCHDLWDIRAYRNRIDGATDPGWETRQNEWGPGWANLFKTLKVLRIVRGASYSERYQFCRSAYRGRFRPSNKNHIVGFRLCLAKIPHYTPAPHSHGQPT